MCPRAVEMQFVLAVYLAKLIFRKAKCGEPVDEIRRKHLGLAVERITGEPNQLFLAEPDSAGVIELGAKLSLVNDLGETDVPAAIDDRKDRMLVRVECPDHLQHQQFVEIRIEQAAHDRVEPPAMIIGPGRDVCDCHFGTLSPPKACSQWREPPNWPGNHLTLSTPPSGDRRSTADFGGVCFVAAMEGRLHSSPRGSYQRGLRRYGFETSTLIGGRRRSPGLFA